MSFQGGSDSKPSLGTKSNNKDNYVGADKNLAKFEIDNTILTWTDGQTDGHFELLSNLAIKKVSTILVFNG